MSRQQQRLLRLPPSEGSQCDPRKQRPQGSESGPTPDSCTQGYSAEPLSAEREELIQETIALFEHRYGRPISSEEARQIMVRLTSFFQLLVEWGDPAGSKEAPPAMPALMPSTCPIEDAESGSWDMWPHEGTGG